MRRVEETGATSEIPPLWAGAGAHLDMSTPQVAICRE
jgi:hypothetical protein